MKRYGDSNVIQSDIKSDGFASPREFNKLVVNSLSEVDQGSLDPEVIIFNKEDDKIYTYDSPSNWIAYDSKYYNAIFNVSYLRDVTINNTSDTYNAFAFDSNVSNYLSISPDLFDFGDIGSPVNFVIDFWLINDTFESLGTLLYNGLNTQQVDLEDNKNLLITTSGSQLIKDPNYQDEPTVETHPDDDGYLNVYRPRLKSQNKILNKFITHVALIRSGATTYLAIDGKIEDSADSVEYFHYDNVLVGAGYIGKSAIKLINLRVSKNTDRGWTTDFTPPNFNHTVDGNTNFLMDSSSFVDTTGNHTITVVGDAPAIVQDQFQYIASDADLNSTNITLDHSTVLGFSSMNFVCNLNPTSGQSLIFNYPSGYKFCDTFDVNDLIYSCSFNNETSFYSYPTVISNDCIHITDYMRDRTYSPKMGVSETVNSLTRTGLNYAHIAIPLAERFLVFETNSELSIDDVYRNCVTGINHPQTFNSAFDMQSDELIFDTTDLIFKFPDLYSATNTPVNYRAIQFDIKLTASISVDQAIFEYSESLANVGISNDRLYASNYLSTVNCDFTLDIDVWYRVYTTLMGKANHGSGYSLPEQYGSSLFVRNLSTGVESDKTAWANDSIHQPALRKIRSGNYLLTNIVLSEFTIAASSSTPVINPSRFMLDEDNLVYMFQKLFN